MSRVLPIAAALLLAIGATAHAQDRAPPPPSALERPAALPGETWPRVDERRLPPSAATGQFGSQMRTNIMPGSRIQGGPTIDVRPSAVHPETPAIAGRDETPVELGGFVGYLFGREGAEAPASLGLDLQFATDPQSGDGGWSVQPGIDYSTTLTSSWHLNTRLFSTYATDHYASGVAGLERPSWLRGGSGDAEFKDVGIGLGLGYTFGDNWNVQTQARYQRMLRPGATDGHDEQDANQFFGGVMLDYRF